MEGAAAINSASKLSCATYQSVVYGKSSTKDSGFTVPVIVDAVDDVVAVPEQLVIVLQTCPQLEVAVPPGFVETAQVDVH